MTSGQKTSDGGSIDYDALIRAALIGVVRDLLADAAKGGLIGNHHFYLAFSTTHPRVAIPEYLRALHPKDMTIVLQNQFWDLTVTEDMFSVKLSFNGKAEKLTVPFDALVGFLDPSVQFALQFREVAAPEAEAPAPAEKPAKAEGQPAEDGGNNVIALDIFRKQ
ncbi:ClpXP protease specificity-enhancing factor SspB [Iodidimonas sp. SYSU 1G8]|uniref:SspB family protein n=1 Tax=Iodidimonas sp. SYSU 1G8 TaxID=3133967 RepID=UPI0031FE6E2F